MVVRRRRARREPLSRERIEEAALQLIEREGLDGFSTRRLATELGCEAMSIYHYFPSKAHIMDALADRVLREIPIPPRDLSWQARLRAFTFGYRAMALRYPQFFQFLLLYRMNTATALGMLEKVVQIFDDAGFDPEATARLFRTWGYYMMGGLLDEIAGYAKGPSAAEPVPDEISARDFPVITAINPYFKPQHHEATFALGLDIMLEGIERRLSRARATGKTEGPSARRRRSLAQS